MTHFVDTMMYTGEVPWHGLGTYVGDKAITSKEAIEAARLDWEVESEPIYYRSSWGKFYELRKHRAIVRYPDESVLGLVSDQYTPLQNKEAFGFFDALTKNGEAIYHTAGSLKGGRIIWILAKLPATMEILRDDLIDKYVLLSNAHDGSMAVRVGITPIRVVCYNTLSIALLRMDNEEENNEGSYSHSIRILHRGNFQNKWKDAQELLGLVNTTYNSLQEKWRTWASTYLSAEEIKKYIENVYPQKGKNIESPYNVWAFDKRGKVEELLEVGKGTDIPGVRGTLWGLYNAVVEAQDWGQLGKTWAGKEKRLYSNWYGNSAQIKVRALTTADKLVATR